MHNIGDKISFVGTIGRIEIDAVHITYTVHFNDIRSEEKESSPTLQYKEKKEVKNERN